MGLILTLILGGIVGWVASMIMRTDAQQGVLLNIVVGVAGAFLGGWISGFFTGTEQAGLVFDLSALLWALLGAVALLAVVNMVQKGRIR